MKTLVVLCFLFSFMTGCTHTAPLKAPCNWTGSNCHPRIKINQWEN